MLRVRTIVALSLVVGCGTLASPSVGNQELPSNRTGPFRELSADEMGGQSCIATDFMGLVDEPSVLALADGRLALYASRVRDGRRSIARVALRGLQTQEGEVAEALGATLPWQGMGVSSPDVTALPGGGYAMAYATASGVLGLARSGDGVTWQSLPTPALEVNRAMGEESDLRAPTLVVSANGAVTLVYASAGSLWLARAESLGGGLSRVDADPRTPRRDPLLGAISAPRMGDAGGAPGFESGALDDPELMVETTAAGRAIWRIYYTARSAPVAMDGGVAPTVTLGMAASYDGLSFTRYGVPILTSRMDATLSAPAVLALDERRTLLYVGARCDLSRGRRGVRAAIAPSNDRLAVSAR